MTSVYVMARNGGSEGHSPPIIVFGDYSLALSAMAIMDGPYEIFEVPVWPERAKEAWYAIKPVAAP